MIGAIAGDIIGSAFVHRKDKPEYSFKLVSSTSHFTANTILTVALAESILKNESYLETLKRYFLEFPNFDYGGYLFGMLISPKPQAYYEDHINSAARISPIGWAYNSLGEVLNRAKECAELTHCQKEGIKGAQAIASAVFLSRTGNSKKDIKEFIEKKFKYDLNLNVEKLRKEYSFSNKCQDTVPQAIFTFLESKDFEDSLRLSIYIGGNTSAVASMNAAIAEAYYSGVPQKIKPVSIEHMDLRLKNILTGFHTKYCTK